MKRLNLTALAVSLILLAGTTLACNIKDSPCDGDECCRLVFNFRFLSFSYCRRRNENTDRCAKNDYCLRDSDCASDECEGASTFRWGRCKKQPCLKIRPLNG